MIRDITRYIKNDLTAEDHSLAIQNAYALIDLAEEMLDRWFSQHEVVNHLDEVYKSLKSHFIEY